MTPTLTPGCSIETRESGPGRALRVAGTLSWRTAPALRVALSLAAAPERVLLDLTDVERIDSAGTGAVIAAQLRARRSGSRLALLTGPAVADIVDARRVGDAVPVFSDRDAAYEWLAGAEAGCRLAG